MGIKKWLKRLTLVGLSALMGFMAQPMVAQTSFWTDRAVGTYPINSQGVLVPIPYGQVRVCGFPAVGSPCTNPANGFVFDLSGNPLTVSGGNFGQITTDVVGRFSFGCTPGTYQVQVAASSSNTPQLSYPITCPIPGNSPPSNVEFNNITADGTLIVTGITTLGPVNISGNVPTSPALGATGGALNVQKTTGGTAIYNARFLDSFGNTNAQIIGVNTEQLLNPSSVVNYLNFVHVDEGAIPTTNTVNFTGGDQTATYGSMSDFGSGTLNSLSGGGFEGFNSGPATATLIKGVTATANNGGVVVNGIPNQTQTPTNNGNATNIRAFDGVAKNLSSGTVTNGVVFYAEAPQNTGGGTFTNAYGLFVADMIAAANNFAIKTGVGKVSIGDAATFNSTVQAATTVAVGTTPVTTTGILENNSNLTGAFQFGYQGAPVCSSASTLLCEGIRVRFDTAAAPFTVANGSAIHITEGTKGAGSTITNEIGLNIDALSNGGTNIAIQVANPIKNTLATGTAPFVITSTTPVANLTTVPTAYDHTGAQITAYHLVEDSCVLGTSCGVTLAGASAYTNATSYTCICQDDTAIAACKVAQTAGNAFTITGTGTDTIRYHCGGN